MGGKTYIIEKGAYTIVFAPFKYNLYSVKIESTSIKLLPEERKVKIAVELIEKLKDLPENFDYAKAIISGAIMIAMKYYR